MLVYFILSTLLHLVIAAPTSTTPYPTSLSGPPTPAAANVNTSTAPPIAQRPRIPPQRRPPPAGWDTLIQQSASQVAEPAPSPSQPQNSSNVHQLRINVTAGPVDEQHITVIQETPALTEYRKQFRTWQQKHELSKTITKRLEELLISLARQRGQLLAQVARSSLPPDALSNASSKQTMDVYYLLDRHTEQAITARLSQHGIVPNVLRPWEMAYVQISNEMHDAQRSLTAQVEIRNQLMVQLAILSTQAPSWVPNQ